MVWHNFLLDTLKCPLKSRLFCFSYSKLFSFFFLSWRHRLSNRCYQIEKRAGFLCAISRSQQPIAYVPKFCRNFKTSKKKKKPVESEIETNGSVSGSAASDVGGVRLFAKSRSLLKPDEPVTETKRQTKPDLLAHRKVCVRS